MEPLFVFIGSSYPEHRVLDYTHFSEGQGACWTVLRECDMMRRFPTEMAAIEGVTREQWTLDMCAATATWSNTEFELQLLQFEDLLHKLPFGYWSERALMHRRIKCCLFQLAEASERYGGTVGQYALLKLCDVLHVLAMLVWVVITSSLSIPTTPAHRSRCRRNTPLGHLGCQQLAPVQNADTGCYLGKDT